MKNIKLSLISLLFSGLLIGCGMKGPLYRESSSADPIKQVKSEQVIDKKENSSNEMEDEKVLDATEKSSDNQ